MEIEKAELLQVLILHTIIIVSGLLLFLLPVKAGVLFLMVVILYNVIVPLYGWYTDSVQLINIWLYSFLLSILQVVPDWILSDLLQVLVFPDDGLFKMGPVSGYMWGLWTVPFVLIIYLAGYIQSQTENTYLTIATAAGSALVIFGIAEMTLWQLGSWYAQNVATTLHIAHYIIIPEILLGIAVYLGYWKSRDQPWIWRYLIIISTMVFYTGATVLSYFFMEFL